MRRVISIMDQDIGEPTSTFTLRLANALVEQSHRVAVIDGNSDGHLSRALNLSNEPGLSDALLNDVTVEHLIRPVAEGIIVVPAGQELAEYDHVEAGGSLRAKKLKQMLDHPLMQEQDFILITTADKQGLLMVNALFAASEVMVPTAADYSSLQQAIQSVKAFKRIQAVVGNATKLWLVLGQLHVAGSVFEQVKEIILAHFPSRVFKTILMENDTKKISENELQSPATSGFSSLAQDVVMGRTY